MDVVPNLPNVLNEALLPNDAWFLIMRNIESSHTAYNIIYLMWLMRVSKHLETVVRKYYANRRVKPSERTASYTHPVVFSEFRYGVKIRSRCRQMGESSRVIVYKRSPVRMSFSFNDIYECIMIQCNMIGYNFTIRLFDGEPYKVIQLAHHSRTAYGVHFRGDGAVSHVCKRDMRSGEPDVKTYTRRDDKEHIDAVCMANEALAATLENISSVREYLYE